MKLSQICTDCIKNSSKFKSIEGLMQIYSKLDSCDPLYSEIRIHAVQKLAERYPMLREKYGIEEMKLIFSPEDLDNFEKELKDSQEIKSRFAHLKGTVLAPVERVVAQTEDGCYPIDALIQGAAWPSDVDPSKRESYLSDKDFLAVFKMTKSEFAEKDKYVRLRLKKEHKLF